MKSTTRGGVEKTDDKRVRNSKKRRPTLEENEARKAAEFNAMQPLRPTEMTDPWKELGLHDVLTAGDLVADGTVQLVRDLVNTQFRVKALLLHPDKNDSITAAVAFGRVQQARNDLLGLEDMASIRNSWRKSIGDEVEEKGERFPSGLQLAQKHVPSAAATRSHC